MAAATLHAQSGEPSLLSDNIKPGEKSQVFPANTNVIETGASYEWVDTGKYATDSETLNTGKRPNNTCKCLFDGAIKGHPETQTFSKWAGGLWATIRIDLKEDYQIEGVDVWAFRDIQKDTESVEILLSSDGENFSSHGFATNTEAPRDSKDFVKLSGKLDKPALARHLELRAKRLDSAFQQQLAEIAVWGRKPPEDRSKLAKADEKPVVKFTVRTIQDGAAFLSWKEFAKSSNEVLKWRIYVSSKPFSNINEEGVHLLKELGKAEASAPAFPFEPGSTIHFGITGVYPKGESQSVESIPCKFRTPFQCDSFGEMLAINHFWSGIGFDGGSAHVKRDNPDQWNEVALDMLAETPVRECRWWLMSPEIVKKFLRRGIGMITFPSPETIKQANSLGLHSFTAGNEPEFHRTPEAYLNHLKDIHAKAKEASPWNVVSAPTCNLNASALEWLDKFYAAGAKDHFEVLDLHTYSGATNGSVLPEGYPKGAPEALVDDMRKVREITAKHGDSGKPVISTEFGYCDSPGASNPAGEMTPLRKAQYLTRGLILHYALGFKRVYIYSFWDEGTDIYYKEHVYGIVDNDLQKKPAFHALDALNRQLGDCILEKELEGCQKPSFGYLFKSKIHGDYVAAIWDGSGEDVGSFTTEAKQVTVTDIFGKSRGIVVEKGAPFTLPYGASPVYIRSETPIRMLSSKRMDSKGIDADEALMTSLPSPSIIVPAEAKTAEMELKLKNGFRKAIDCKVIVKGPDGTALGMKSIRIEALSEMKEKVEFKIDAKEDVALLPVEAFITYKTEISSYADKLSLNVRRLTGTSGGPVCKTRSFAGSPTPLYVLANNAVELSFDPSQGGRMIDFIDRKSLTNQIHMDYDKIASLKSFAFEYFWFDIEGLKNDLWESGSEDGKLRLHALNEKAGLDVTMLWSLDGDSPNVRLEAKVTNKSGKQAKGKFHMHPEYNLSGMGRSFNDILLFPTKDGVFKMPFWTCLGERKTPELTEPWWAILDSADGLEMRQTWSAEWSAPRIWFGNDCYNLEMNADFDLQPEMTWKVWLTWKLSQAPAR